MRVEKVPSGDYLVVVTLTPKEADGIKRSLTALLSISPYHVLGEDRLRNLVVTLPRLPLPDFDHVSRGWHELS